MQRNSITFSVLDLALALSLLCIGPFLPILDDSPTSATACRLDHSPESARRQIRGSRPRANDGCRRIQKNTGIKQCGGGRLTGYFPADFLMRHSALHSPHTVEAIYHGDPSD